MQLTGFEGLDISQGTIGMFWTVVLSAGHSNGGRSTTICKKTTCKGKKHKTNVPVAKVLK